MIFEGGNESDCELILARVRQIVLDLVQSMLLHYNVRLLSLRLDVIHSAHLQREVDLIVGLIHHLEHLREVALS